MKSKKLTLNLIIGLLLMIFVSQPKAAVNGKIAFGSGGRIYTINPDGSGRTEIADSGYFPTYSPDGNRIAFYRNSPAGIYLMDADGSDQTLLTPTAGGLFDRMKISWSPDGAKIAFTCGGICIVNADGGNQVIIESNPKNYGPDWSPDGSKIAFTSIRDGNGGEIYKMNIDGSGQERLTFNGNSQYPDWSPDGTKIVYTYNFFYGFLGYIYTMKSDGSNQTLLTGGSVLFGVIGRPAYFADWSPDGTKITYSAFGGVISNLTDEYADVYVIYADGSSPRNLTNTPPFDAEFFADWGTAPSTSSYRTAFDFDGDGLDDVSVFRPSNGVWYLNRSSAGSFRAQFGVSTDKITPADFDGDGKTDIATFRNGVWFWLNSSNGNVGIVQFGVANDIPVPADYSGDGRAELAVYRGGTWWIQNLTNNQVNTTHFGISTDKPVVADYDGDGHADQAVYRNGEWHLNRSSQGYTVVRLGLANDQPVVGDYDGDGKADEAIYRGGTWYLEQSSNGFTSFQFGIVSDIPAPADYDGDRKTDAAVYRNGTWWILQSIGGNTRNFQFGLATDKPVPTAFAP